MNYKDYLNSPIFFEQNRVWRCYTGGKLLGMFTGEILPRDGHFPEDWLASTTVAQNGPNQQSQYEGLARIRLEDGSMGPYFRDILSQYPKEALGIEKFSGKDGIGVLCKYLDSAIRLPIQCHPDIPFARKYYDSEHGKSESWFILDTRSIDGQKPYILMGFKENVDPEQFKIAVSRQDIAFLESCLHKVAVCAGDSFFIPGRMPHAIGPGVFLLEVQEPTDWVVQVDECIGNTKLSSSDMWGPLKPAIGLECFDYAGRDTLQNILKKVSLVPQKIRILEGGSLEEIIGPHITSCFCVDRLTIKSQVKLAGIYPWYIAVVVEGSCMIKDRSRISNVKSGDYFFVSNQISELILKTEKSNAQVFLISQGR